MTARRLLVLAVLALLPAGAHGSGAVFTATTSSAVTTLAGADDWTPPSVALAPLGSYVQGTLTPSVTASDTRSSVATAVLQRQTTGGSWVDVCTASSAPWSCGAATGSLADGSSSWRVIATDTAGNSATSSVRATTIDNTAPSVSLGTLGPVLSGSVSIAPTVSDAGSGIASVVVQRAPAGTSTWTTACTASAAPWSCTWATGVLTGSYDLRVVATDAVGNTTTVTAGGLTLDNTGPTAGDVQAPAQGTAGKLGLNDVATLTFSEKVDPSTLVPGWSGASPVAITARVRDGAVFLLSDLDDVLELRTTGGASTGLGTIALHGDFLSSGSLDISATAALSSGGTTVTVTLGSTSSLLLATSVVPGIMVWTPASTVKDVAGNVLANVSATETGALDIDF